MMHPTKAEEAERIRDLKHWPRWPWLPLKRIGSYDLGVIFADDVDLPTDEEANGPIRVFDINLFTHCTPTAAVALTQGIECPWPIHQTYANVEEMVADGWLGD